MKHFLLAMIFGGIMALSACNSGDEPIDTETTVEEDKTNMANALDQTVACMTSLKDGDFVESLTDFLGVVDGEVINDEWMEDVFNDLDGTFDFNSIDDNGRFDFDYHKGIYEYNATTGNWTKTASNDKIEWRFPATPSSTSNNAILAATSYSDIEITMEGDKYWAPVKANASLTIDNKEIFRVKLNNVVYETEGSYNIPVGVDIEIYTAPYDHHLVAAQVSNTEYQIDFTMENNGACKNGISSNVKLNITDLENLDEESVGTISFTAFSDDMSVELSVNGNLLLLDDPTPNQINSNIQADVFMRGVLVGELSYREINGEEEVFIIYKDGTEENADVYYDDFAADMEALLDAFM